MKTTILTTLLFLSCSMGVCFTQTEGPQNNLLLNRSALKHIKGATLESLEANDPINYAKLKYYITASFEIDFINCTGCTLNYDQFFNYELFDVVQFESLRLPSSNFSFPFSNDKYTITLKSKQAVESAMDGLPIGSVLGLHYLRPFPEWTETGNSDLDYTNYKLSVNAWAVDFPEEYRIMTNSSDLIKIKFANFLTLDEVRKLHLFESPGGYLIID